MMKKLVAAALALLAGRAALAQGPRVVKPHNVAGDVGCASKLLGFDGSNNGACVTNAPTASAFDHDPSACPAGQFASDQSSTGVLTCSEVPWTSLTSYPATCGAGAFVQALGDSPTCASNAATATALAADGSDCPAGQASRGVDASGNAQGCFTPSGSGDVTDVGDCASGACFTSSGTGTELVFHGTSAGTGKVAAPGTLSSVTLTLPNETGTICSTGSVCSGYAQAGSCSAGYYLHGMSPAPDCVQLFYQTVQSAGTPVTQRPALNFTGAGVSCADDGGARTTCTIPGGSGASASEPYLTASNTADDSPVREVLKVRRPDAACPVCGIVQP